ncbi:MAG: PEP-CTERM sorting domain-containing protein [Myxococcota bacterium]
MGSLLSIAFGPVLWLMVGQTILTLSHPANAASVAPSYGLTDLGDLGATAGGPFFPRYISQGNQVVGVGPTGVPDEYAAYSSVGGAPMQRLDGLLANGAAFAVNSAGVIVGQSESGGTTIATRWDGGIASAIPGLSGPNNSAGAINDAGQIAGWMDAPTGGAVAYRITNGVLEPFGNLGGRVSDINGMNAAGRFVGNSETAAGGFTSFRAFVSDETSLSLIDLGLLEPGHTASLAFGINDLGTVIGTSNLFIPSPFTFTAQGFIWQNGVMTEIERPIGYDILSPSGINNENVVVGRIVESAFGGRSEAWIYDGTLQLLTPRLDAAHLGWQITNAWEINDAGFIAAEAIDPGGVTRNVLLTPIPEPGTALLMGLGIAGLSAAGRRIRDPRGRHGERRRAKE